MVEPSPLNRKLAHAYRAGELSTMFLIDPRGKILKNDGWELHSARAEAEYLAREAVGQPIHSIRAEGGEEAGWGTYRKLWRKLAGQRRPVDSDEARAAARDAGPKAVYAVMMAGAVLGTPVDWRRHSRRLADAATAFGSGTSPRPRAHPSRKYGVDSWMPAWIC